MAGDAALILIVEDEPPIRRLLRRDPEIIPIFWQQTLRVERVVLPKRFRFARKLRLRMRRR